MNITASTVYISVLKFAKKRHCISQALIEKFNIHFVDNVKIYNKLQFLITVMQRHQFLHIKKNTIITVNGAINNL